MAQHVGWSNEPDLALSALLECCSLEITAKEIGPLRAASNSIAPGTRVHITYLGNEDLQMRVKAAAEVRRLGFEPVPHIAARRIQSTGELEEFLGGLESADAARQVFVVGGDPSSPVGPYPDALSIIESGRLKRFGVEGVGIAGYPEAHPDIALGELWHHLEAKTAALADQQLSGSIVTQFTFDTAPVLRYLTEVRERNISTRVRVGVPGPAGIKRLLGFARKFGIGANAMAVRKYGISLTNLVGSTGPDRFMRDLSRQLTDGSIGDVLVHFYTFGDVSATADWARERLLDGVVDR